MGCTTTVSMSSLSQSIHEKTSQSREILNSSASSEHKTTIFDFSELNSDPFFEKKNSDLFSKKIQNYLSRLWPPWSSLGRVLNVFILVLIFLYLIRTLKLENFDGFSDFKTNISII